MDDITEEWLERHEIEPFTLVPGILRKIIPTVYRCKDVAEIRQEYDTLTVSPLTETTDYISELLEYCIRSSTGQQESLMRIRSDNYDAMYAMTRVTINSVRIRTPRKLSTSRTDAWTYEIEDETESIDAISQVDGESLEQQMRDVVASSPSQQFDIWAKPLPDWYTIDDGIRQRGKTLWVYDVEQPGGSDPSTVPPVPTREDDLVAQPA